MSSPSSTLAHIMPVEKTFDIVTRDKSSLELIKLVQLC